MKGHYLAVRFQRVGRPFTGSEFDPDPDHFWTSEADVLSNWREVASDLLTETEAGEDGASAVLCRLFVDETEIDRFVWEQD